MANISAAAMRTKLGVIKKENLAGPQPTLVPTTYKELQKTCLKKWADWLHNPYRLGGPQRFRAGDKISSGPQVGALLLSFYSVEKNCFRNR